MPWEVSEVVQYEIEVKYERDGVWFSVSIIKDATEEQAEDFLREFRKNHPRRSFRIAKIVRSIRIEA